MPTDAAEIERAYRQGQVDAKLEQHDDHLKAINGSQARMANILDTLSSAVDKLGDQMTGLLVVMPRIQTVAERQIQAEEVASALKKKNLEDQTTWERRRSLVAWSLGSVIGCAAVTNLVLRIFTG